MQQHRHPPPSPLATAPQALLPQLRFYASKEVRFGIDSRERVLVGVNKLADAVQVTLGPKVCYSPLPHLFRHIKAQV